MSRILATCLLLLCLSVPAMAAGKSCPGSADYYTASVACVKGASAVRHVYDSSAQFRYRLHQLCKSTNKSGPCNNPRDCTSTEGTEGTLYAVLRQDLAGGPWTRVMQACLTAGEAQALGQITPGMVAKAWQRLTWPRSELSIQPPDGQTLVDFDTNFFTSNTRPTTQVVTLLGQRVTIEATPSRYHWHFGDGATTVTSSPGHKYPHLDVTHDYADPGHVRCSVDVTYTGRFRVNDDPWQQIPGTLTVGGDAVPLWVRTASPVLTG